MNAPSTLFADSPEPETEPLIDAEEPEPEPEPEPEERASTDAAPSVGLVPLMDVLPADFALPALIRFVPDVRLRATADQAAAYALSVTVTGAEGLQLADAALMTVKNTLKAIEEHFAEPCDTANQLHKRLTGIRGEWTARGKQAVEDVGRRMWQENRRLEAVAAEERRQIQAEEDRKARERLAAEAKAAEAAKAPAPVVQELQRQAETATAPPVARTASAPPALKGSSSVTTWKARIAGTPASDEPNPDIAALSPAQRLAVFHLVVNVAAQLARDLSLTLEPEYLTKCQGAPLAALAIDWSYLNKRAKADKATLTIPGIEAFEDGGIRSKGTRSRS